MAFLAAAYGALLLAPAALGAAAAVARDPSSPASTSTNLCLPFDPDDAGVVLPTYERWLRRFADRVGDAADGARQSVERGAAGLLVDVEALVAEAGLGLAPGEWTGCGSGLDDEEVTVEDGGAGDRGEGAAVPVVFASTKWCAAERLAPALEAGALLGRYLLLALAWWVQSRHLGLPAGAAAAGLVLLGACGCRQLGLVALGGLALFALSSALEVGERGLLWPLASVVVHLAPSVLLMSGVLRAGVPTDLARLVHALVKRDGRLTSVPGLGSAAQALADAAGGVGDGGDLSSGSLDACRLLSSPAPLRVLAALAGDPSAVLHLPLALVRWRLEALASALSPGLGGAVSRLFWQWAPALDRGEL